MEREEKLEILENEIEKRKKIPRSFMKSIGNDVFQNLVVALFMTLFFLAIDIMFFSLDHTKYEVTLKYSSIIFIFLTVGIFEIAYRKDSKPIMIYGIEFFIASTLTLYIPHIFIHTNAIARFIFMLVPLFFTIYYFIKSFIIWKGEKIKYLSDNISDVKEIMNYEENGSYIDEKSEKTFKKKQEYEKNLKRQ